MKVLLVHTQLDDRKTGAHRRVESIANRLGTQHAEIFELAVVGRTGARGRRFFNLRSIRVIREKIREHSIDAVFFCGIEFAPATRFVFDSQVFLDVCDSQDELSKKLSLQGSSPLRVLLARISTAGLYALISARTRLSYITKIDLEQDTKLRGKRVATWYLNSLNLPINRLMPRQDFLKRIGFIADFSYGPNMFGLNWFLKNVFTQLVPPVALALYGPNNPGSLTTGVEYVGYVEDLQDAFVDLDITICPDFTGAGQKNKVVESLLAGRPVLTTTTGVRGINNHSGVIVLDSPEEWVQALNRLSTQGGIFELSMSIGELGRPYEEKMSAQNFKQLLTCEME